MQIRGYAPGTGRQFTPSIDATWTDDFNELLKEYNSNHKYSRNRLTEKCIQLGMKVLQEGESTTSKVASNSDGIFIPYDRLSHTQIEFLNTQEGQTALIGIIKMLFLGDPSHLADSFIKTEQHSMDKAKREAATSIEDKKSDPPHTISEELEEGNQNTDIKKLLKMNDMFGGVTHHS